MIDGKWTYRSYLNNPALVDGDAQTALADIFGEGVFNLSSADDQSITGVFEMGGGYALDLTGTAAAAGDGTTSVRMAGIGRAGTATDGWVYEYAATTAYAWPKALNQVPTLVGSVLRAKPHNGGPAGVTASFVAIKRS